MKEHRILIPLTLLEMSDTSAFAAESAFSRELYNLGVESCKYYCWTESGIIFRIECTDEVLTMIILQKSVKVYAD